MSVINKLQASYILQERFKIGTKQNSLGLPQALNLLIVGRLVDLEVSDQWIH